MSLSPVSPGAQTRHLVEELFARIPSPEEQHTKKWKDIGPKIVTGCNELWDKSLFRPSSDPDQDIIKTAMVNCSGDPYSASMIDQQLAALAFTKTLNYDKSQKARYLRYIRWVAEGKKDEASPFIAPPSQLPLQTPAFFRCRHGVALLAEARPPPRGVAVVWSQLAVRACSRPYIATRTANARTGQSKRRFAESSSSYTARSPSLTTFSATSLTSPIRTSTD